MDATASHTSDLAWDLRPGGAFRRLTGGIALSLAAHTLIVGLAWWGFHHGRAPILAELDLSMAAAISSPRAGGSGGAPVRQWKVATTKTLQTHTPAAPEPIPTGEALKAEAQGGCVGAGCAGEGGGSGTGAGGAGLIDGAAAARAPRWVGNFITSADYPRVAQDSGKDGRVVLTVVIDEKGRVRDAALLRGAYPILNEVALRKIRGARFTPAFNEMNRPVPCRVTLPIRFELR